MTDRESSRGERIACWVGNAVAVAYLAWLASMLSLANPRFASMYEAMSADLPRPTVFVVQHGVWLHPLLFGVLGAAVLAKDLLLHDKRLSVIIAFVITIAGQFLAHALAVVYYLPMFNLIDKMSR